MLRGEHARRPAHGEDAAARGAAGPDAPRPADEPRAGERRLVREAQRGSSEALENLFRLHWPSAYRAAYFIVHDAAAAEDIAQEAFLAAVRALDRFDRRRPFAPWIHRIVVNRSIDFARARALRREVDMELAPGVAASPEPAAGVSDELLDALAALGPDQRAVVVLRYLLGCTPARSRARSRSRAGRSTLACAARSTRSPAA